MAARSFFIKYAPGYKEHPIFINAVKQYNTVENAKSNIAKKIKYAVLGTKAGRDVQGPVADYRVKLTDPKLWCFFAFIKSITFRNIVLYPYEEVSKVLFLISHIAYRISHIA